MGFPGHPRRGNPAEDPGDRQNLEGRMDALEALLTRLEARVARLEGQSTLPEDAEASSEGVRVPVPSPSGEPIEGQAAPERWLSQLGQVLLVLAGAFLIRALTEAGRLPTPIGALAGFAYAMAWAWMADRARKSGRTLAAHALGFTAAGIAFPLLWEATVRFGVLPAPVSAFALLGLSGILMAVAWRGNLRTLAWISTLATLGMGLALMIALSAVQTFATAFLVLGLATLWATYGRQWHGLRWPTALTADASILILGVLAAWPGGPPAAYRSLSVPWAMAQCLGLVVLYLGSFALRTLQRNRAIVPFEGAQTALVLLIGLGGALRIASAWGWGQAPLGLALLASGAACYAVAFAFVERQTASSRNFWFYTSLALVFVLIGLPSLVDSRTLAGSLALAGLLAAALGSRFDRTTLRTHAAIYLGCATLASGYFRKSLTGCVGAFGAGQPGFGLPELPLLIALGAAHLMLLAGWRNQSVPGHRRLPSLVLATLALLGFASLLATGVAGFLPATPGAMAALRTVVLSLATILVAAISRAFQVQEHRWLVYPLLGFTTLQFLLQDLAQGKPSTLLPAMACLGVALVVAPTLIKRPPADEG